MKLTPEDRRFLSSLKLDGSPTGSWDIPTATRKQDMSRTRAKRRGWAVFDRKTWAWRITEEGRAALTAPSTGAQDSAPQAEA